MVRHLVAVIVLIARAEVAAQPAPTPSSPAASAMRYLFWDAARRTALVVTADGQQEKTITISNAVRGTIIGMVYSPRGGRLAVLTDRKVGKAEHREILVIDAATGARTSIERARPSGKERGPLGYGDALYAESLGDLAGFSPDGALLAYTRTGFEFCEVVLSTVDGKRKLNGEGCCGRWGVAWSPSGSTLAYFSAPSMDTGNALGFLSRTAIDRASKKLVFPSVEWKKVSGDKSALYEPTYDGKSQSLSSIMAADFLDENRLLLATEEYKDQMGYAVFDRKKNSARLVRRRGDVPWGSSGEWLDRSLGAFLAMSNKGTALRRMDLRTGAISSTPMATAVRDDLAAQPSCRTAQLSLLGCSGGRCMVGAACSKAGYRYYVVELAEGKPMTGRLVLSGRYRHRRTIE